MRDRTACNHEPDDIHTAASRRKDKLNTEAISVAGRRMGLRATLSAMPMQRLKVICKNRVLGMHGGKQALIDKVMCYDQALDNELCMMCPD